MSKVTLIRAYKKRCLILCLLSSRVRRIASSQKDFILYQSQKSFQLARLNFLFQIVKIIDFTWPSVCTYTASSSYC